MRTNPEFTYKDIIFDEMETLEVLADEMEEEGHDYAAQIIRIAIEKLENAKDILPENCTARKTVQE